MSIGGWQLTVRNHIRWPLYCCIVCVRVLKWGTEALQGSGVNERPCCQQDTKYCCMQNNSGVKCDIKLHILWPYFPSYVGRGRTTGLLIWIWNLSHCWSYIDLTIWNLQCIKQWMNNCDTKHLRNNVWEHCGLESNVCLPLFGSTTALRQHYHNKKSQRSHLFVSW